MKLPTKEELEEAVRLCWDVACDVRLGADGMPPQQPMFSPAHGYNSVRSQIFTQLLSALVPNNVNHLHKDDEP